MDMLTTMRFVRGAVATKDLAPEMKHFWILDGGIRAYNGVIALYSPIDFSVSCMPLAAPLVRAISNCNEVMAIGMTENGRLRVQSGPFRAFIECIDTPMPQIEPQGQVFEIDGAALMEAIKMVMPFIGSDASRPWVNGIYLKGQSAFATNNVCVVEYWIGTPFPMDANIPIEAIREMVRLDSPPIYAQICEHSITFHYADGRWLRTQLYSTDWPDLTAILDRPANLVPLPPALFEALEVVKPFTEKDNNVYIRDGSIHTDNEPGIGASYQVEGLDWAGIYKLDMLKLLTVATYADMTTYPEPCMFQGGRMRGAIIGLRP